MTTKQQILDLIPDLPPADIPAVRAALNLCGAGAAVEEPADDWLLAGMIAYLQKRGLLGKDALFQMQRSKGFKTYGGRRAAAQAFLEAAGRGSKHGERIRPRLAFLASAALAALLERQGIFSVTTMLQQIDRIPVAIDDAYPGYVSGGLLGFVLDQKEGTRNGATTE